jgi:lipoate---protein ligase
MTGRLLDLTFGDPYANVAFEEALLRKAESPTLRVWDNQRSVVLGRAQLAEFETDIEYCRRNSIPVVRRVTAGGAVYNGPGNLNWSFVVPGGAGVAGLERSSDAKQVFRSFAALVLEALRGCGVECSFVPPNSVAGEGGKVCGMAAFVSKEATLCHGTLLLGADLEEVQRVTRPAAKELPRRYPRSRFTDVANCGARRGEFVASLAKSGPGFGKGEVAEAEASFHSEIVLRYRSEAWNLGDPFALDYL